ncbi:NAD(P)-dependent alcohol dehydrogenase (plasmid) [Sphingobium sp. JS3065]|nr:NAD(P)-dependent alcohol dehydrogenase [Sphingobium sp. JS3065]UZW58328.1 NAD(P)-dependent alcohol dehydrogenase [Sphingobium sp. JS3065]
MLVHGSCTVIDPGPGEIRVRNQASSLNFADLMMMTGQLDPDDEGRIPLADGAGIVDAVGSDVSDWAVGDCVMARFFPAWDGGPHTPARWVTRPGLNVDGHARVFETHPASWFARPPAGYSAAEAATLGCAGLTAWRALFVETHIKPGDWVLTQGSGGVSIFALQFAVACGARVIATSSSNSKAQMLRDLGATHVLNYNAQPDWGAIAYSLADGRGCDAVIDVAGGTELAQSFAAVREAGFIGQIGILGGWSGELSTVPLMQKNARLQGLQVGSLDHIKDMVAGIEATGIRPLIAARYPLDQLSEAITRMLRRDYVGKIVIEI